MASDQQLLRWRSTYGISDDAFNSLQIILARSGRNETLLDNTTFFQSDDWFAHTTHLNGSLFEVDPFIDPSVVDRFLTDSHAELGPSADDAPANDDLLTGNYNSLFNGHVGNLQDPGPLHQFDDYNISSTRETGLSNMGDATMDVLPYYEQTTVHDPRGPQPLVDESTAMTLQPNKKRRFAPYPMAARGNGKEKPSPPCVKCWVRRRKCHGGDGERCKICIASALPAQVCIRIRFADNAVSSKWQDADYRVKLEWENLHWISSPRSVLLTHGKGGPKLSIDCREFVAVSPDQTRIPWKDKERWNWIETTAFGLQKHDVDLDAYISDYSELYLAEASQDGSYIGEILTQVKSHLKSPLVGLVVKYWAANRLLMEGWQLEGEDLLEMPVVKQSDCPLYNKVPVPRVLENQLDLHLESYIVDVENKSLKMLQDALLQKSRNSPVDMFLSAVLSLHVVERDIWRLLFWVYHNQQDYEWRHRSTAVELVGKSVHFSKVLLAHIRCAGIIPDDLVLQLGKFRTDEKPHSRYNEIEEDSLDSTLSSLAIVKDIEVVAELYDFVYRNGEAIGSTTEVQ